MAAERAIESQHLNGIGIMSECLQVVLNTSCARVLFRMEYRMP
jgi:hypothetical protein